MPERAVRLDVGAWVRAAPDQAQRELRQCVHTILVAAADLRHQGFDVVMKGGILVAIAYDGDRFTRDVDFSVEQTVREIEPAALHEALERALAVAVERLSDGIDCRVQRAELNPRGAEHQFQTLQMTIGYAPLTDTARQRRLARGEAPHVVSVDVSYNERIVGWEVFDLGDSRNVVASTLADLVAEKYRAMIQQPLRHRARRQDAYDLDHLLTTRAELAAVRANVLEALRRKAESRGVPVSIASLRDPAVRSASQKEYALLAPEVSKPLAPFDEVYGRVQHYYESLGWE